MIYRKENCQLAVINSFGFGVLKSFQDCRRMNMENVVCNLVVCGSIWVKSELICIDRMEQCAGGCMR